MKRLIVSTLLAVAVLATPAVASAKGTYNANGVTSTLPGFKAPGTPAKYDKVFVTKFGPKKPARVLVLIPGTSGGAGNFTLVAQDLVKKVPGLGVWAIDRRSQALEDTSAFKKLLAGKITEQQTIDYYLGHAIDYITGKPVPANVYQPIKDADVQYAKDWGLNVSLNDIHVVVEAAKKASGHKVILGGHSLGGSTTTAYSVWDFGGKPAWKDLSGLVLIDGSVAGAGAATVPTLADEQTKLAAQKAAKSPWLDLLNVGLPWATGVFVELGAIAARLHPTELSQVASLALLPASFKPPFPVTNRAQLGYALDEKTSPAALGLIHVRSGHVTDSGDPRDWVDDGPTPIANVARAFGQEPTNGAEWYFPTRLSLDLGGLAGLQPNAVTKFLGLHPKYASQVKLPVYAIQTSLSQGRLKASVESFVKMNGSKLTFVDASNVNSHLDPLLAAPKTSAFLMSVIPWLKKNAK